MIHYIDKPKVDSYSLIKKMRYASDISNCDLPIYVRFDESWYVNIDQPKDDTDLVTKKTI